VGETVDRGPDAREFDPMDPCGRLWRASTLHPLFVLFVSRFKVADGWDVRPQQLLLYLKDFSTRLTERTKTLEGEVERLTFSAKAAEVSLKNVFNDFLMLSNTQFIENVCLPTSPPTHLAPLSSPFLRVESRESGRVKKKRMTD